MGRWGSTAINRLIKCMFSAKTRDTHRSSIIDWLPDRRQKWKTKLIYSCFFRGDKLDPEIATQWLIINAYPTYTTSPLYPLLSSAPSLCLFYSLWLWSLLQFAFDPRIAGCNCWLCCFCFLAGFGLAFFELLSLHAAATDRRWLY